MMNDRPTMYAISSGHFSHNMQVSDALDYLRIEHPASYSAVRRNFPENIIWCGPWFDHEAMGVDIEWASWLCDAIEATGHIEWIDGEPYATE